MNSNKLQIRDRAIHDWYRFVLAYPPHLVREYLDKLDADPDRDRVFDPFAGTATTPLEARLNGFGVMAVDANPVAVLGSGKCGIWTGSLRYEGENRRRCPVQFLFHSRSHEDRPC
ncbi:MAG: hypothetical protein L6Q98_22575 [Anaerolineae bacterium]|nr:hypothetical protein [Anaerolineae bacterium]